MSRKPLFAAGLVLAVAATGLAVYWPFQSGPAEMRLPGTVEIQEVRLSSRVGGRVKSLGVQEGDTIKAGHVLVTFDVPEMEAKKAQAVRQRDAASAALERARNGATPEERAVAEAAVATAQAQLARVKAPARPEDLDQAQQDINALAAETEYLRLEWERQLFLQGKGASSDSIRESAKAAYLRAKAQGEAAAARLRLLKAGARREDIATAEADLKKAQALRDQVLAPTRSEDVNAAAAKVEELVARIAEIDAQLAELTVTAPEPVVVDVVAVRPGDVVAPNQPVARVLRATDLWVKAFVASTDLGKIRRNQAVEVSVDSHPGQRFPGTIASIASVSEFTPRNVQSPDERKNQVFAIKVRVADSQGILKSGMAADVYVTPNPEK